jgi:glucans biosynthesis protein C
MTAAGLLPSSQSLARYRRHRALLAIGVLAPVVAAGSVVAGMLAFPGFDNATQYLSELGAAGAARPELFNIGVLASGIGAGAAGLGFALAVLALGGSRWAATLLLVSFVVAGVGLVIAGLYHWPDPRHRAVNLGLGIQLAPLLLLWGLARTQGVARLKSFLAAAFLVMAALTVLTKHLLFPGLVNDANVGWWERAFAVVLVGWSAVAAICLERRLVRLAAERG